jgi:hypothetical protein
MKPCRTCRFALPEPSEPETGWCHRVPPRADFTPAGAARSMYPIVGLNKPGCGEHRFAWLRTLWMWLRPSATP